MTWALLALLVVSNAFWLAVVYASGRKIARLERLVAEAVVHLNNEAVIMRQIVACWPRREGH